MSIALTCSRVHAESLRLLIGIAFFLIPSAAGAANRLWDNVEGGFFSEPNNWFGGVPETNDVARFETTNSSFFQRIYTVDFTNNPINDQLVVEDDNVTFVLFDHTYTLRNTFVAAAIGTVPGRSGNLTVRRGTLNLPSQSQFSSADLEIAPVANGSGVLTVGAGGVINGSPDVLVGLNGNGTLDINGGGNMIADKVTIGGNLSASKGTVNIRGGGNMTADDVTIGHGGGGTGTVNITDNDSTFFAKGSVNINRGNNAINVSAGGRFTIRNGAIAGALNIKGGGHFESGTGIFQIYGGGVVTVDGMGSTLDVSPDNMFVSDGGVLNITGGGQVRNRDSVTVTNLVLVASTIPGIRSDWTIDSELTIKDTSGTGIVRIQAGGTVHAQQTRVVGNALLFLEGGTLDASEIIFDSAFDQFIWTAGTLRFGTCNGNLTAPSAGILAPRLGPTGATIKGDYNQQAAGATLAVEIGGPLPFTDFGVLTVEGTASLGGNLQITLTNGFTPTKLSSFDILRSNSGLTGSFANVADGQRLATSDGLGSFVVEYLNDEVVLSDYLPAIPGDFNHDFAVNTADYVVWRKNRSALGGDPAGYNTWRANFGRTVSGGSGVLSADGAVPEPATHLILLLGLSLIVALRRSPQANCPKCIASYDRSILP